MVSGAESNVAQRHVVIYGGFGYGNTGNDATLSVTLEALRRLIPDVRFTVVTRDPENVAATHAVDVMPLRPEPSRGNRFPLPLRKMFREWSRLEQMGRFLSTATSLMIPGTGIFDDFNVTSFEIPYPLWLWCRIARSRGVPVAYVAVGAGPVEKPLSMYLFRRAALLADHRSYRDENSRAFARDEMGIDVARDALTPDIVFGMKTDARPLGPGKPRVAGLGLMAYHTWRGEQGGADDIFDAYITKMVQIGRDLLDDGCEIRVLTGDPGDKPAIDAFMRRIREEMPDRAALVTVPAVSTLQDILRQMKEIDAVIATRFHTIVAALMSGRPAVSVGYTPKNSEVMKQFGLGDYCQNIGDFEPATIRRHFVGVTAEPEKLSRNLLETAHGLHDAVHAHFAEVAARVMQHQSHD